MSFSIHTILLYYITVILLWGLFIAFCTVSVVTCALLNVMVHGVTFSHHPMYMHTAADDQVTLSLEMNVLPRHYYIVLSCFKTCFFIFKTVLRKIIFSVDSK